MFRSRMKTAGWSLILFAVLSACARQSGTGPQGSASDRDLREELERMGKEDQSRREEMMSLMRQGLGDPAARKRFDEAGVAQREIDTRNMNRLREILQREGWPGFRRVGKQAGNAAFLILQHAGLEDQKEYFPLLKEAALRREASPADAAMMEDRILMREGKNQVYGTQLVSDKQTGKLELWPVENEEEVDSRRAAVGMPPLGEYLKGFGLEYHPPAKK